MTNLKIGLCGTGNVGSAFLESIVSTESLINRNYGLNISISLIGARKGKVSGAPDIPVITDIQELAMSDDVDVVVELIGGVDDAYKLAVSALKNKKHFVTANKALIAAHSKELFELAKKNQVHIGFEASVAGGIPIIRTIRDGLICNQINSFAGILNGTSNFIFSKMADENLSFDNALSLAQKEGFAEPDPSFDISGQDAAQKTSILATLSFFQNSSMENVYFEGIDNISPNDIDYGKQLNFVLKPLSVGIKKKDQISLGSFPAFVKIDSLLASIQNENNAVLVNAENVGGTMYSGPGAGAKPTANSVLSDVIDIARGKIFDYGKFVEQNLSSSFDSFSCDRYLKLQVNDKPGVVAKISTLLAKNNLSIDNLIQKELERSDDQIPLVIVLSNSDEMTIQETIKELESLDEVSGPLTHIRILDI
ncbi:homoserine dehydrogenase [bacterium]|nr:homoserine dehydrogenase [bacterium]